MARHLDTHTKINYALLMRHHIIVPILFSLLPFAAAVAEAPAPLKPPTLIRCQGANNCDRDHQHLEDFVTEVYRWYMKVDAQRFSISDSSSKASKKREILDKGVEDYLKKSFTPDFWAWRKKLLDTSEGYHDQRDYNYCGADVDTLLCTQDIGDAWLSGVSAQLIAMEEGSALLLVRLPSPPDAKGNAQMPLILLVDLQPYDGYWRLRSVRDIMPNYKP